MNKKQMAGAFYDAPVQQRIRMMKNGFFDETGAEIW